MVRSSKYTEILFKFEGQDETRHTHFHPQGLAGIAGIAGLPHLLN